MKIQNKLLKIRNMIDDESLTEEERNSWRLKYLSLKNQYKLEENEIIEPKVLTFRIITKNDYEDLLIKNIALSYGLSSYYIPRKKESKNSFRIKCTQETYDLIIDDFKYFNKHLALVLKASTIKFISEHIEYKVEIKQEEQEEPKERKFSDEDRKIAQLMQGMSSIEDMDLKRTKILNYK